MMSETSIYRFIKTLSLLNTKNIFKGPLKQLLGWKMDVTIITNMLILFKLTYIPFGLYIVIESNTALD